MSLSESEAASILATKKQSLPVELAAGFAMNYANLPDPHPEYRFAREIVGDEPGLRKRLKAKGLKDWRFDLAWPQLMVAAEVEGGGYVNGGHVRGRGFANDLEKYGWAAYYGWTVYRCDSDMIRSGLAIYQLSQIIRNAQRTLEIGSIYERATQS